MTFRSFLLCLALLSADIPAVSPRTVSYKINREAWTGEVERLSWSPRMFRYRSFLSDEECDYLIDLAVPKMKGSLVIDADTGEDRTSTYRTSTGTALDSAGDELLMGIDERISGVSMLPVVIEHQETLQILRYVDGQKYDPHYDFFDDPVSVQPENGGQRFLTVLIYLSDVEVGGETVFPNAETELDGEGKSTCAKMGFSIRPRKGDAILFYSLTPDLEPDETSLHGSCPTIIGEKWSATKWIHLLPVQPEEETEET